MSQASPKLIAITLAVSTSALYYASKSLTTRENNLDLVKRVRQVKYFKQRPDDRPILNLTNDAKVTLTPIEEGFLIGTAEDGTYLATIGEEQLTGNKLENGIEEKLIRYFVRYPDGTRKEFSESSGSRIILAADGSLFIYPPKPYIKNSVRIVSKSAEEELQSNENYGFDTYGCQSDGNLIPIQTNNPTFYNKATRSILSLPRLQGLQMNRDGMLIMLNSEVCQFGSVNALKQLRVPARMQVMDQSVISTGKNPKYIIKTVNYETNRYHCFEVFSSTLAEIPVPRLEQFSQVFPIAISSTGDFLMHDGEGNFYLRRNWNWTNLTEAQGIRLAVQSPFDENKNRLIFENGRMIVSSQKNGKVWICRLEVSN